MDSGILARVRAYNSAIMHENLKRIDGKQLYSAREAAQFLEVTPDTVKSYCRSGKISGKQVGPKKNWMVLGSEIARLRKDWNLD